MTQPNPLPPLEFDFPELPGLDPSSVEVSTHPALPSLTAFPDCLIEKYAGSYRMSWQPRSDRQLSLLRHRHIFPAYTEDYDPKLLDALRREGFSRESLKEGLIWNGDCVLCLQPLERHYDDVRRQSVINRRRHTAEASAESLDAELQRLAELTGHRSGQPLVYDQLPGGKTSIDEHVIVDKRLKDPSGHRNKTSNGD